MRAVSQDRRRGKWSPARLLVGMLLAVCAGCHERVPEGQVLAVVNGDEITIPELNAEARARGLVIGDNPGVRQALLQELIDRRLLAQAARKQGIDRTPDYILASRRAAELALVQELTTDAGRSAEQPTREQLSAFIAANPQAFGNRAVVTVEQMALPAPVPADKAAAVARASSLEEAAAILGNKSLAASKAMQTWDTARLDRDSAATLLAARVDQLVALHPPGSGWVVLRKISATPAPVPRDQQAAYAAQLAKAQISQQFAVNLLSRSRSQARIAIGTEGPDQGR
jgi:peptidyl-prolyl cis-trans isomerase C